MDLQKQSVGVGILVVLFGLIPLLVNTASAETSKGDLVVEGNEVYSIENKDDLHIDGNIIVKDNAKLIIRNTKLTLDITSFASYMVYVYDNASLEIYDSTLTRAKEINVNIRMQGKQFVMKNSTSYMDLSAEGGTSVIENSKFIGHNGIFWKGGNTASLFLSNSEVKGVQLSFSSKEPDSILIDGLRPGVKDKFDFTTKSGAALHVVNSTVSGWIIEQFEYFDGSSNKTDLTIKDSEIYLWLWFGPRSKINIKGLKPGFFSDWEFDKNAELAGVNYKVHLINTEVGGEIGGKQATQLKLHIVGEAILDEVEAQIATWGSANVVINNSRIVSGLMLRGNETIHINNTVLASGDIEFIDGEKHIPEIGAANHKVYFSKAEITASNSFEVACDQSFIGGEVKFNGPELDKINWDKGIIIREYSVLGKADVSVVLYDQNNNKVWQGKTDADGVVKFEISFTKNNYKQDWQVESGGKKQKIGFLSDTPINLNFSAAKAENLVYTYWKITLITLTSIAIAAVIMAIIKKRKQ